MGFRIKGGVLKKYVDEPGVTEVVIPEGVREIGEYAFSGCSSLTTITIPEGVTEIGDGAFYGCDSLTSITIPESVTKIDDRAFEGCTKLASVTIPKGLKDIGYWAFEGCESLTNITIPEGVTKIGNWVFCGCESLTSVTIPEGVTGISQSAFRGTPWLDEKKLLIRNSVIVDASPKTCTGALEIPEGVTKIGGYAFLNCTNLTSITIPEGVREIGERTFWQCTSLTSVIIPEGVREIGDRAFLGCESLTGITIPESVTEIGNWVFCGCESLTSVTIPEGVTGISQSAFRGTPWLDEKKLLIRNSVIVDASPKTCTGALEIPEGVTKIGGYAFQNCTNLTSITIPKGLKDIGYWAFEGCESLTNITIPEGVREIGGYAFSRCSSLTSITIPEGATGIKNSAFDGCTSLPYIDFHGDFVYLIHSSEVYLSKQIEMQREKNYGVKMDHNIKYPILWKRYAHNPEEPELLAYVKKNFSKMFPFAIEHDDVETVKFVCEQGTLLTSRNIGKMIEAALKHYQNGGSGEILSILQDYLADMAQTATLPQLKKFFDIANAHDLTELKMRVMHIKHERFPEDEQQENDFSLD